MKQIRFVERPLSRDQVRRTKYVARVEAQRLRDRSGREILVAADLYFADDRSRARVDSHTHIRKGCIVIHRYAVLHNGVEVTVLRQDVLQQQQRFVDLNEVQPVLLAGQFGTFERPVRQDFRRLFDLDRFDQRGRTFRNVEDDLDAVSAGQDLACRLRASESLAEVEYLEAQFVSDNLLSIEILAAVKEAGIAPPAAGRAEETSAARRLADKAFEKARSEGRRARPLGRGRG